MVVAHESNLCYMAAASWEDGGPLPTIKRWYEDLMIRFSSLMNESGQPSSLKEITDED